jgi:hypothetical protein
MNKESKEDQVDDIEVIEEKDGSATVELPDHIESPHNEGGEVSSSDDADQPGDTEAIREARRNRRRAKKEYIKKTHVEKDAKLTLLERQNQQLVERLSVLERKQSGADLARFDKAIEDEQLRLQYATAKLKEATDNADGSSFAKAQELWYNSKRKLEAMQNFKSRAAENGSDTGAVNPKLQRLANDWMENNDWYDPNGGDEDSQIAKVIDNRLVQEGFDPATEEYWDELDSRLQRRLPHKYNQRHDEQTRRRPKTFVTGSSRESSPRGSGNSFVLEPEQVRAMKDAGMWDDAQKRAKMIKRYAEVARNNRS